MGTLRWLLQIDLVEDAAFIEVRPLRLRPAAGDVFDGEKLDLRESRGVLCQHLRRARPEGVPRRDLLSNTMRKSLRPIRGDPPRFRENFEVRGLVHRDRVRLQAIEDGACLLR